MLSSIHDSLELKWPTLGSSRDCFNALISRCQQFSHLKWRKKRSLLFLEDSWFSLEQKTWVCFMLWCVLLAKSPVTLVWLQSLSWPAFTYRVIEPVSSENKHSWSHIMSTGQQERSRGTGGRWGGCGEGVTCMEVQILPIPACCSSTCGGVNSVSVLSL